jgi:hypothetical protein
MADKLFRFVGEPDFHDGHIRAVTRTGDSVLVIVEGSSTKRYAAKFDEVTSVESYSPENMMLYGLSEEGACPHTLHQFEFVNWYHDEPEESASKSFLRIRAVRLSITPE